MLASNFQWKCTYYSGTGVMYFPTLILPLLFVPISYITFSPFMESFFWSFFFDLCGLYTRFALLLFIPMILHGVKNLCSCNTVILLQLVGISFPTLQHKNFKFRICFFIYLIQDQIYNVFLHYFALLRTVTIFLLERYFNFCPWRKAWECLTHLKMSCWGFFCTEIYATVKNMRSHILNKDLNDHFNSRNLNIV